jgi:hypothetical protein
VWETVQPRLPACRQTDPSRFPVDKQTESDTLCFRRALIERMLVGPACSRAATTI